MSQASKSFLAVALIAGLILGLGIGWVAKPEVPPDVQAQIQSLQSERDSAISQRDALQTLVDEMKAALVGVGPEAPIRTSLTGEVKLGGLFSLSGVLASYGENEYTAALLAAEHVNALLGSLGEEWTLAIVAEDTQTSPSVCLEKVESFAARGIKLLIGPLSSAEVRAIKGYCDANKILAISQSSTAPDLAIAGDYIFRFCPSDEFGQGPAIGRILYDDGKRYMIPVSRNDAWGVGLEEAAAKRFRELGGTVLPGIRYSPDAVEFAAEAADLASKVQSAVSKYGADKVCVLHISFEEVNAFFTAASEYEVLTSVKWYGSDGTCAAGSMVEDPVVAEFAHRVQYPSTIFAPTESAKWEMVRQNGIKVLGREPESYSYAVYDIVWAYALSILKTGSTDPEAIREVLPEVASSFFGASGWIELNEEGDRKAGDYVIWQIVKTDAGTYDWKVVGKYVLDTDSVEWFG
ncbi:MAG: ABC transporter substrate-binding protein [Candidatus Brockarchaeota archaeon]|nr:ABC transporter substrate-binding protein [Candidatus Brockarchaeota archaeon]